MTSEYKENSVLKPKVQYFIYLYIYIFISPQRKAANSSLESLKDEAFPIMTRGRGVFPKFKANYMIRKVIGWCKSRLGTRIKYDLKDHVGVFTFM